MENHLGQGILIGHSILQWDLNQHFLRRQEVQWERAVGHILTATCVVWEAVHHLLNVESCENVITHYVIVTV